MYSEETEHVESRYGEIEDMLEDRIPFREANKEICERKVD
jgi:hypothetical protein